METGLFRRRGLAAAGIVLVALAGLAVLLTLAMVSFSTLELRRFARAEARSNLFVYSAGQRLAPGVQIRLIDLGGILSRLGYSEVAGVPAAPGQFRRSGTRWEIVPRGGDGAGEAWSPGRIQLDTDGVRITRVFREGNSVEFAELEGEVLTGGTDQSGEDHRPIRLIDAPRVLVNAVLAAEDRRFFTHRGLDLRGLARAAWANVRAGRIREGGSTITQQLIKIRLLTPERTMDRKLREAWLAFLVEWRYAKEQILEAYLNEAYLGQRGSLAIRGMGAAARAYFAKEPHQLSAGEAALLAGMLRAPNTYSPAVSPDRARERRDDVLSRMHAMRMLDDAAYARGRSEPVRALVEPGPGQVAPYFADHVRQEIERRFEHDGLPNARVKRVVTTLDPVLQRFAEDAVARGVDRLETQAARLRRQGHRARLQVALVALEPTTGEIRALVGGRDYRLSQFNRAVHGRRQPGSAFKPFVYLAALQQRDRGSVLTAASRVDDSPLTLMVNRLPWTPRNYGGRYEGRVTVRRALEQSLNSATVRLAQTVGPTAVIDTARSLGITARMEPVPALALGVFDASPVEMARAYAAFANGGMRPPAATSVRALYQSNGKQVVAEREGVARAVMSAAEAYLMTSLMTGVVRSGTATSLRALGVPGEIAGKTGTTNEGRDAWFVGYSSRLLTVVWVGYDQDEAHGLAGAQAAIPIWADFMKSALETYPAPPFVVPPGIVAADIDPTTGKRATGTCPLAVREVFLAGTEPPPCGEHAVASDQASDQMTAWRERLRDWAESR